MTANTTALGLSIAYSCARSDIECFTKPVQLSSHYAVPVTKERPPLYDLSSPIAESFERQAVTIAVTWLDAMGLLQRHPSYPHLVSIAPAPSEWVVAGEKAAAASLTA